MMSTKSKLLFILLILFLVFCARDKNPFHPPPSDNGYNQFSIKTEKSTYTWQQSESTKILIVQGTLENKSSNIYYSKLGDFYGGFEQDQLLIAENSAGSIEKYDEMNKKWNEINILGLLIEGSKFVSIKPSKKYSIYAHLSIDKDKEEKGKYRFRIDYFDTMNPEPDSSPFYDYSNTFEIK